MKTKKARKQTAFFPPIIESNGPLSTKTIRNGHFSEGMHIADKGKKMVQKPLLFPCLVLLKIEIMEKQLECDFSKLLIYSQELY